MNPLIEQLLQPVSEVAPCGPDLSYDPRFDELEMILRGKPEVEMGSVLRPAEPPNWIQLKKASAEFLGTSRHLRVAVMYCGSLLKVDGLAGFRDGLQLVRGLLENFWGPLHPVLDPDDDNDPQQRLNILSALTAERNSYSLGWLQIIDSLCSASLCSPRGAPPITLDQILAAAQQSSAGEGAATGPDAATLAVQIRSVGAESIAAVRLVIQDSIEAVQGIDSFLNNTLGATQSISFEELENTLKRLDSVLASQSSDMGAPAAGSAPSPEVGGDAPAHAAGPGVMVSGAIRSRADVVRVIDTLCDYYQQCEPGSPVPYLLRRAQKMATMTFLEAMHELSIASPDTLRPSLGHAVDTEWPQQSY